LSAKREKGNFGAKKGGTNGLAVRAGRPVTQLTSSSGTASSAAPSLEYIQGTIDSIESKYKNRNYFLNPESNPFF
jgi:hypothetical protein